MSEGHQVLMQILLVEDNPGDVLLTRRALRNGSDTNNLSVVADGDEAIQFLRHSDDYGDAPRPDLVILDWNLPGGSGREVLTEIKGNPALRQIPVVVFTSSSSDRDVIEAYDLHANCYCTKPVKLDEFVSVLTSIENFWLTTVRLPAKPGSS
jgi:chemotaxis family two-component system response regulator Rcp1